MKCKLFSDKLFNRCWMLSLVSYAISFLLPVYGVANSIELHWGEGIGMALMGGLTIMLGYHVSEFVQFLIWLANPMYIQLMLVVAHNYSRNKDFLPTLGQKLWAVTCVLLASWFFFGGQIITSESGAVNEVTSFRLGYWMWWAAMVLLAAALLLQEKTVKPGSSWQYYLIAFVLLIFTMITVGGYRLSCSSTSRSYPMTGKTYSGYYKTCQRIEVSFTSDFTLLAVVSSTDFVGHGSERDDGHYTYHSPFIDAYWHGNTVDMQYALLDQDADELIIYGKEDTYYLRRKPIADQGVTNWPMLIHHLVDQSENEYYVLPQDSKTFGYGTNAQELRLPEGYHLSYQQILERQLQKMHYNREFNDCFTTYGREEDWLHYEDDSLQIVFERMCIQTQGHRVVGIRDYSVIPEVIYDKRKTRLQQLN